MERAITPHAINGFAKVLRKQRDRLPCSEYPKTLICVAQEAQLNEIVLETAIWLNKNGIDCTEFIQRSGYVDNGN